MSKPNNVIYLHQCNQQAALERLNRVTGLEFSQWPQSLVPVHETLSEIELCVDACAAVAERLSSVAHAVAVRP